MLDNIIKSYTGIFLNNFSDTNSHEKLWLVASSEASHTSDSLLRAQLINRSSKKLQKIYNKTSPRV